MPSDQRTGRSSLPDQRTLLSWLFVGRLVLAVGVLLGAGLVWTERPQESFLVSVAVVFALVFTAYGAWVVFLQQPRGRQRLPAGPGDGGPGRGHHGGALRGAAAVGLPVAVRPGRGGLRAAHAAGLGGAHGDARVRRCSWAMRFWSRTVVLDSRVLGPDASSSTWSSPSWRCWGTGSARPGWSRPRWPPSSSGSGSRRTTSSATSARACSRWTGWAAWPSSTRRRERLLDLDGEDADRAPGARPAQEPLLRALGRGGGRDPERAEDQPRRGDGDAPEGRPDVPHRPQHHDASGRKPRRRPRSPRSSPTSRTSRRCRSSRSGPSGWRRWRR